MLRALHNMVGQELLIGVTARIVAADVAEYVPATCRTSIAEGVGIPGDGLVIGLGIGR